MNDEILSFSTHFDKIISSLEPLCPKVENVSLKHLEVSLRKLVHMV